MAIRSYRKPLENPYPEMSSPNADPAFNYEEIFVIMESPLLELTHKDLFELRGMHIDPFIDVE